MKKLIISSLILCFSLWIILAQDSDQEVISWLYSNWLTKYSSTMEFRPYDSITRGEAAKFMVEYAKLQNLTKTRRSSECIFSDTNAYDKSLVPYITEACEYWLFKWFNGKYIPTNLITKGEAIAVVIRSKYGIQDESNFPRYKEYYSIGQQNKLDLWPISLFDQSISRIILGYWIKQNHNQQIIKNSDKYDIYVCNMNNERLSQPLTEKLVESSIEYDASKIYWFGESVYIAKGDKPNPNSCNIFWIYQCTTNGWSLENKWQMTQYLPSNSSKYLWSNSYVIGSIVYTERNSTQDYPNNRSCNKSEEIKNKELDCSGKLWTIKKNNKCICPSGMERNDVHQCDYIYDRRVTDSWPDNNLIMNNISAILDSQDQVNKIKNYRIVFELKNSWSVEMILSPKITISCKINDSNNQWWWWQLLSMEEWVTSIKPNGLIKIYSQSIIVWSSEYSQSEDALILLNQSKCIINVPRNYIHMHFDSMRKSYSKNLWYEYFDWSIRWYLNSSPKLPWYDKNGDIYMQRYYETNYVDNTWEWTILGQ